VAGPGGSPRLKDAQVLVTGKCFSGLGLRAIGPVLQELVLSAQEEIHLMSYLLTDSAAPLIDMLEEVLEKGVRVTAVVNSYEGNSKPLLNRLQALAQKHRHARVFVYSDADKGSLHAKVLVADRKRAVVGSANLSWGGMVTNNEISLLVEDSSAWALASLIDRLATQLTPEVHP
jgi:phosphatidylserine/phosphatidylglycerophosphate/cardiolipin synthase-like enzyme